MAQDIALSNRLLRAIGATVVYHAEVEHWVDAMVYGLHSQLPGARKFIKKYPTQWQDELSFLEQCFAHLPEMRFLRVRGKSLIARIRVVAEDRHHLVHGYLQF